LWQVGVNAPGTANSTTFLPLKISSLVFGAGPSGVMVLKVAAGMRSPTLIVMVVFLSQIVGKRERFRPRGDAVVRARSGSSGQARI
jgi:threonine dehydrogenase-like Zn-dependent dehydrogenase